MDLLFQGISNAHEIIREYLENPVGDFEMYLKERLAIQLWHVESYPEVHQEHS